ncbi:hypothetical protein PGT21_019927 [Puccinia graminis f. sp. tritici]|uniref:Uncharacterized protein n=1 Tax=Puccinia graminis f. sp. tritici TaxID=56615 RepID=A0A5B0SAZ0_PUCGR|nr:hypothetical protein PGT21_019927 [Puccinia graminis f. sp. tritici]KAA1135118.1 hypothetical protein PGTUg99_014872 [Puccinia graminis f. sp. tritici]
MPPRRAPAQARQSKTKKKAIPWDRDGVNGGDSSIDIVLDWLSTGNNYERWRGDNEKGMTKTRLCSEIVHIMNQKGIRHRDTKGVRQKIGDLQSSYNTARDFVKNTGEGIMAADELNGVHTVYDCIYELCRYWNILDPIMAARSVTEPLHIRSSVGGDQPGHQDSTNNDATDNSAAIEYPASNPTSSQSPAIPGDAVILPDASALLMPPPPSATTAPPLPVHPPPVDHPQTRNNPKSSNRSTRRGSSRPSKYKKKNNTEDLYMMSIISKRQAEVTRARAEASKVKVSYMKELREHGLSLEEIERKAALEFPPCADMDDTLSNENSENSD